MRRRLFALVALIVTLAAFPAAPTAAQAVPTATPTPMAMPTGGATPDMLAMTALMDHDCGLPSPAFCDTFDTPSPGGRAGDLNDANWSFARITSTANVGQGQFDWFPATDAMFCRTPISGVLPDRDSFFCNAGGTEHMHWMTAMNDQGAYALDSALIRQPFDFAGRTGVVTFGVDAVTRGPHSWWPSLVIADQPLEGPHPFHPGEILSPRNGISVSFDHNCDGPGLATVDPTTSTVNDIERWDNYTQTQVQHSQDNCIAVARDTMNRIQVRISQQEIQVWGSDAGTDTLKLLADAKDLNLPFTRGYVSLQQSQYNAEKFDGADAQMHTYHWHDVGFDGPVLPTPRAYEVPDALTPWGDGVNLGYLLHTGQPGPSFTLPGVDLAGATGATLSLDVTALGEGGAVTYRLNGGPWRSVPFPLPVDTSAWVGMVADVPLGDLRSGNNTIQFGATFQAPWSNGYAILANVDLQVGTLAGVGTPPLTATPPTAPAATVAATPAAAPTAAPTATAVATSSATSTTATASQATVTVTQNVTETVTQTVTATLTSFTLACTSSAGAITCRGA